MTIVNTIKYYWIIIVNNTTEQSDNVFPLVPTIISTYGSINWYVINWIVLLYIGNGIMILCLWLMVIIPTVMNIDGDFVFFVYGSMA